MEYVSRIISVCSEKYTTSELEFRLHFIKRCDENHVVTEA
jgi:hypothetical protein